MKPAHAVLACLLLTASPVVRAQDVAPPADGEIAKLVLQLGDADFGTREAASRRLGEIGKPALDALKEAADGADAEIRTRATALVRRIEKRALPGGPLGRDAAPAGVRHMRVSVNNGVKNIVAQEQDREFVIDEGPDGIEVTVTAVENGQSVTEVYRAKTAAELKETEPDAFAVYERFGAGPAGAWALVGGAGVALEVRDGGMIFDNGIGRLRDDLDELRERLDKQMRDSRVAAQQARDVLRHLDRLQQFRWGAAELPADQDARIQEYFRASDALRKKLADLKLDAADDVLPPPPNQRLGVQLNLVPDPLTGEVTRLLIQTVVADSRAARIGLKGGDVVLKINDNPVRSTKDIRDVLAQSKGPLVVEVRRADKALKLTEKTEKK